MTDPLQSEKRIKNCINPSLDGNAQTHFPEADQELTHPAKRKAKLPKQECESVQPDSSNRILTNGRASLKLGVVEQLPSVIRCLNYNDYEV